MRKRTEEQDSKKKMSHTRKQVSRGRELTKMHRNHCVLTLATLTTSLSKCAVSLGNWLSTISLNASWSTCSSILAEAALSRCYYILNEMVDSDLGGDHSKAEIARQQVFHNACKAPERLLLIHEE